jgi:hypothetical protein
MWYAPELLEALTVDDYQSLICASDLARFTDHQNLINIYLNPLFRPFEHQMNKETFMTVHDVLEDLKNRGMMLMCLVEWEQPKKYPYIQEFSKSLMELRNDKQFLFINSDFDMHLGMDDVQYVKDWFFYHKDYTVNKPFPIGTYIPNDLMQRLRIITLLTAAIYFKANKVVDYLFSLGAKATMDDLLVATMVDNENSIYKCLEHFQNNEGAYANVYSKIINKSKTNLLIRIVSILYNRADFYSWIVFNTNDESFTITDTFNEYIERMKKKKIGFETTDYNFKLFKLK